MAREILGKEFRGRVIAAIEEGLSTREAARRFQVGSPQPEAGIAVTVTAARPLPAAGPAVAFKT